MEMDQLSPTLQGSSLQLSERPSIIIAKWLRGQSGRRWLEGRQGLGEFAGFASDLRRESAGRSAGPRIWWVSERESIALFVRQRRTIRLALGGDMGDESQPKYEVFISYSSKDKKWADAACAVLEKHRVRCWVAPRDITPGTEWGAAIISGMDASKIMVVIFSTHANQSAQVRREVERATSKGLIVLPFRVGDVNPAGSMEFALSNMHWLDGFTPPVERQFDLLARSVKTCCSARIVARRPGPQPHP